MCLRRIGNLTPRAMLSGAVLCGGLLSPQPSPGMDGATPEHPPTQPLAGDEAEGQEDAPAAISPAYNTTYFEGPLRANGTLDYVAALNAAAKDGVTLEANAFAELWLLSPRHQADARYVEAMLDALGIDVEAYEQAPYFLPWDRYRDAEGIDAQDHASLYDAVYADQIDEATQQAVGAWLALNQDVLDRVAGAVDRPGYWAPLLNVAGPEPLPLARFDRSQALAHTPFAEALSIRVRCRVLAGETDAACADLIALRRLAAHQSNAFFSASQEASRGIDAMATQALAFCLSQDVFSGEQLSWLWSHWNQRPSHAELADRLERRCVSLDVMQQVWAGQPTALAICLPEDRDDAGLDLGLMQTDFQINRALQRINHFYHTEARMMRGGTHSFFSRVYEPWAAHWEERFEQAIGDRHPYDVIAQAAGNPDISSEERTDQITTALLAHTYRTALPDRLAEFDHTAMERCAMVALASARYRAEHGTYPPHIFALMPEYFEDKPLDPIDGENIRFERTDRGFVVYSIGTDGEDNHGEVDGDVADIGLAVTHPQ